jgi:hypothetical protein
LVLICKITQMKNLILFATLFSAFNLLAQNEFNYSTSTYTVKLAKTITVKDLETDYDPKLILLKTAAPQPLSESKQLKKNLDVLRASTPVVKNTQGFSKTVAPSPLVLTNFAGNITQGTPNDNDMAISNDGKIVSVVNTNMAVYNDTGRTLYQRSLSVFANVLGSLNRTYDPRVIYDPIEDRFVLVFLQGSTSADTRIIIAFSQTNDPTASWNFYVIPGNVTGDSSWSDYPILSLTKDELFITVNRVKDNTPWQQGFITSYIWQCDKKAGYLGKDTINPRLYNNITYNGKSIWNICPVKGGSTLYGPNMLFLSQRPSDLQNDTVFLHEITNTNASGKASFKSTLLRTDVPYGLQPNAIQPNGKKLQTNDARILSALYENGTVHYVGNTIDPNLFAPAVYYGRLYNFYQNPSIEGKIISYDSMDIGYPSISYIGGGQGDNSMLITFSHVSPTLNPGTSVVYTDRFGNLSAPVFVKEGLSSITVLSDSVNRWGDYTGNQRKYNETGVSWVNGSYGELNGANRTWIGKIKSTDPTTGISKPTPQVSQSNLYPNPSNEVVFIDFTVSKTQMVDFAIVDINGRTVAQLLHDKAKAGTNRFSFTVNDIPSGNYFLVITHENNPIHQQQFMVRH